MKQIQKIFLVTSLTTGLFTHAEHNTNNPYQATPYFSIRSQGTNTVREMVGLQEHINRCNTKDSYTVLSLATEYSQSFNIQDICGCLFGGQTLRSNTLLTRNCLDVCCSESCPKSCDNNNYNCIIVAGSCAPGRIETDWVADYFGLPTDYQSTICFNPIIRTAVADFEGYFGFDRPCMQNLYARVNAPLTWTQWKLRQTAKETVLGENDYAAGYFNADGVARDDLLTDAADFFHGKTPTIEGASFEPLAYSKWAACNSDCQDKIGFADLEGVVGWNFVCCDDYHFGLNVRATAPTGNTPNGRYLFEPIIGNGGHWELGGGVSAHANLWYCDETDAALNLYLDGNVTHLFKTCQVRTFDLCGLPNSRYWLALELGKNNQFLAGATNDGELIVPVASDFQFAHAFAPIANLTTAKVEVSANVQADITLMFAYANGEGFTADVGYNFWARSCDKIKKCSSTRLERETWALKGSAYVYGFAAERFVSGNGSVIIPAGGPVALAPSASAVIDCDGSTNANTINHARPALLNDPANEDTVAVFTKENSNNTNTSIQPTVLDEANITFVGTKGMSNKIFAHLDYSWTNCKDWSPFIGVGGATEFGQGRDCAPGCEPSCVILGNSTNNVTNNCARCAISQWSVWIKGGVAFN